MAALSKVTKFYGLADVKIAKMTADASTAPTYDAVLDMPAIQDLALTPNYTETALTGDDGELEADSRFDSFDVSFTCGKVNLDALAVITGSDAVEAGGATPNQTQTFVFKGTDVPNYIKLEGQIKGVDVDAGKDAHLTIWKLKVGKVDLSFKTKDYASIKFSGKAVKCSSNDEVYTIVLNETAAAIA